MVVSKISVADVVYWAQRNRYAPEDVQPDFILERKTKNESSGYTATY